MNTRQRKIAFLCVLALLCTMLAACNDNSNTENMPLVSPPADEPAQVATAGNTLGLEHVTNARQLGGYVTSDGRTIKDGLLLRTGELHEITEDEIRILTETYHVRDIIDFRNSDAIEEAPNPEIPSTKYHNFRILLTEEEMTEHYGHLLSEETDDEANDAVHYDINDFENSQIRYILYVADGDVLEFYGDIYGQMALTDFAYAGFRNAFEVLLEDEDGAVLWHCSQGKDRTGVFTALVLTALGVDREDIFENYLETNKYFEEKSDNAVASAASETDDEYLLEQVRLLNNVDRAYLEVTFSILEEQYGSVEAFLETELGLTQEKIAALKDKYTE